MIYLDNNATTNLHPEIADLISHSLYKNWGNPSASYHFGSKEKLTIEKARELVSNLINSHPNEILFTSCATESNSTVFNTIFEQFSNSSKNKIITTKIEHSSIIENCKLAETKGFEVIYLDVDEEGMINLDELETAISSNTCLVSIMWANNETGVIYPVRQVADYCQSKNVLFHCDAVQAVGKVHIDLEEIQIDYLSLSAHKIHGPKGIGALYIRSGTPIKPLIYGGGQENGIRGGTYNTAYIAALGKACELAKLNLNSYIKNTSYMRNIFEQLLSEEFENIYFNGRNSLRIPNTSNFGFKGIDSEIILNFLNNQDIFLSSGSACTSNVITPSHVITAMKSYESANEAIRLSLSSLNSVDEIKEIIEKLKTLISLL